ncbi:DUF1127 domain-containing protein [Roseobacter sp. EG26]|uniref:DUF1127 domain-containing protein n=1 Tax=Roseobacter sp. EG26 TaxID=3412477 RepID=UPI002607CF16|nr:DUF1127 domain-containing protein [uncultured Roseobacter sp.]
MAYYTQTNTASASLFERALAFTASLLNAAAQRYATHRVYRQTYDELAGLSERELNDLGLSRSMIKGLAWETAQSYTGK